MTPDTAIYSAYDGFTPFDRSTAEKNLLRAVLRSAMEDIRRRGEPYRDAKRFFQSDDDSYLFSFVSICYQLNLCPATLRSILGLKDEKGRSERLAA